VLRVRVERVEIARETPVSGEVGLGDRPAPRGPLASERQVFEMNQFQEVLQGLGSSEYNQRLGLISN
jgi:hypothetical protein